MIILVSTASTAPFDFKSYGRVHLLERLRRPAVSEHSGHILRPRRRKNRRRLKQHPVGSVLDYEASAGLPMPPLPYRFRQDDLTFGRKGGRQCFNGCHYGALMRMARPW